MNFLQLVAKLKLESTRQGPAPASPGTSSKDDNKLWSWIADEWQTLQTCGVPWKFMRKSVTLTTQVGKSSYTPAEIGQSFIRFWPSESEGYRPVVRDGAAFGRMEPEMSYDSFQLLVIPGALPGQPQYYAQSPVGDLLIHPTPDRVFSIDIDLVRAPLVMTATSDEPVGLPIYHRNILVWAALKRCAVDDGAGEILQRANDEYDRAWDRLWDDQGPRISVEGLGW